MPKIDEARAALKELFGGSKDENTIKSYTKVDLLLGDAQAEEKKMSDDNAKLLDDYKALVIAGVKTEAPKESGAPVKPLTLEECADKVLNKEKK